MSLGLKRGIVQLEPQAYRKCFCDREVRSGNCKAGGVECGLRY